MSRSVNKITLVGNVGRDPDIHTTRSGTRVAHLSLATNRRTTRDGSEGERTDWHRLTFWDRLADFAEEHIRLGARLYVEGRLEYDSYERDGVTIPTAEIHVRELVMLSPRPASADSAFEDDEDAVEPEEAAAAVG